MPDAPVPLPAGAPAPIPADPLAGDWSEGLPGPVRALGVPEPRRLTLEVVAQAPVEAVAAPAAWEGATADPLHSTPGATAQEAPTPWSEPVAQTGEEIVWEAPAESAWAEAAGQTGAALPEAPPPETVPDTGHDAWLAPPPAAEQKADEAWPAPAEAVQEWQPQTAPSDVESAPQAEALPDAPPPDWSTLATGPDWSAPPDAAAPVQDAWDAPPEPAAADWMATPAEPSPPAVPAAGPAWNAPAVGASALEQLESEPPEPEPGAAQVLFGSVPAAPAWNAPAVGASALEQLDSEPPEPEPGAAEKLFGSVPAGGSLSGEDDLAAPEPAAAEDILTPVDLTPVDPTPGDLTPVDLTPVDLTPLDPHDDRDLPVALDEPEPPAKPLAALRPATAGALEVAGEHRVAVHTRGGRTLRGTVRDVDLSKSQFALQPQGGGSSETIYHSDVKVIFFMLPPGEKVKAADGERVRVKLSDGRVIEGDRDGAEGRHGFFLVPGDAARTNTRRIYVSREAADEIDG